MHVTTNLILLICLGLTACAENEQQRSINKSSDTTGKEAETTRLVHSDTLIIHQKSAVCYEPDSIQVEALKKEMGKETFYTAADDYLFYFQTAQEYLQTQGLPFVHAQHKKYLKFVTAADKATWIRLDTLPQPWGIYFFQPAKKPEVADMTMIEEAYKAYYQ